MKLFKYLSNLFIIRNFLKIRYCNEIRPSSLYIIIVKFEINAKMYIEIIRHLSQTYALNN